MTCGRAAAAFFWSSSRLARFFCRVRRACRFLADSALRTEVVWRGARDDDDDVSVAAAAAALVAAAAEGFSTDFSGYWYTRLVPETFFLTVGVGC
jgi:hypothetical protein